MNAVVFAALAVANPFAAAVDASFGYPSNGVDIGGGIHVPPAQSRTLRYAALQQHHTLSLWAYLYDSKVQSSGVAVPGGGVVQALDATWDAVVAVGQAVAEVKG